MTQQKGTYAGVRFNGATIKAIDRYNTLYKIPNAVPPESLHTTLLFSRKHLPEFKSQGRLSSPIIGVPDNFEVWPSSSGTKNALVLKFTSKALVDRHKYLMKRHDATYDYDTYTPHVTFSYDIGDMKEFPLYKGPIVIIFEYDEDLDLDWKA